MAIRRQNQIIGILGLVIFIALLSVWSKHEDSEISSSKDVPEIVVTQTLKKIQNNVDDSEEGKKARLQTFAEIVADLSTCLKVEESGGLPLDSAVTVQSLILHFQEFFGLAENEMDKWKEWDLALPNGKQVKLRMEVTDKAGIGFERVLYEYPIETFTGGNPVDIDPTKTEAPSDELIGEKLKQGEVTAQRRSAFIRFASGERVDFVELDGALTSLEFTKAQQVFTCEDITVRESCQCI
jgi:hypothetical protein